MEQNNVLHCNVMVASGHCKKLALKQITAYSQQTGVLIALSPLALLDMVLALWRNVRMIDEIGQIYGLRPSRMAFFSYRVDSQPDHGVVQSSQFWAGQTNPLLRCTRFSVQFT